MLLIGKLLHNLKGEVMSKKEVKLELQVALTDQLYLTVQDSKLRPSAQITRHHKNGWIKFKCLERLSIFDESVSLAVLYIASDEKRSRYLSDKPKSSLGQEMRKLHDPDNALAGQDVGLIVETNLHELASIMGYKRPSKKDMKRISESLERISSITISERNEAEKWTSHGAGFIRHRVKDDGKLSIVIMRRLAMAAFGEKGWVYALLDIDERNALKGDIAKSVHKWLVAWIFESSKRKSSGPRNIGLDKLAVHVWPEWESYTASGKATMRQRLKETLANINALPQWSVTVIGKGSSAMVTVERLEAVTIKPKLIGATDEPEEDEI